MDKPTEMSSKEEFQVVVENLCKHFGNQKAVSEVSFSLRKGEITGFLGPNGAGKSTTMKMLCRYLSPTSGNASVCGISIHDQTRDLRKFIGYLPESNPLYPDLYVKEYLEFIASVHHLGNQTAAAIRRVIEMTGLGNEQHKTIRQLSKGYKQRVGLAQALLHDPQVLILDEPTSGLDPNQLSEIRNLIREAGKTKTILFSSHIMQEVEAVSDRIIVINQGTLVADGPATLVRNSLSGQQQVSVEFAEEPAADWYKELGSAVMAEKTGHRKFVVRAEAAAGDLRSLISNYARRKELSILELSRQEVKLEEVFRQLTGKSSGNSKQKNK